MREFGATWTPDQIRSESEVDSKTEDEFKRLPKDKEVSVKLPPGRRLNTPSRIIQVSACRNG